MPSAPRGPAPKAPEIKVGDVVLERYRVVEQIASGGHSVVYKGQDVRLARPVCIKIFSGLGGDSGVGRTSYEHFVQEAFALSRLTHPNTLRIYDFGHLGTKDGSGMPLQVCEYMNGGTLSNILRERGTQSVDETVRVTVAMCAALAEAHGLGIVHRDIKPQNILFGSVGTTRLPKLADFGIAKWQADSKQDQEQRAEDTAIVAGQKLAMYSPSWAAPEQLAGQPVSPATDIYSLACVAVYMLSGTAVFADEDVYAGYKKRRHADELVRDTLAPLRVPQRIVDALIKSLAFDPKQRLATVDELATALQSGMESQGQAPVPTEQTDPFDSGSTTGVTSPLATALNYNQAPANPTPMAKAPTSDLTPATYRAPPNVEAWMQGTQQTPGAGAPRRLALADVPQPVGDRRGHFVMVGDGTGDLAGLHGTKVRVTLMPGPQGRVVHVKGLTCFVAILGGRPSPAVNVDRTSDVALVTPRAQEIGHLRIAQGVNDHGQTVFQVGNEAVAISAEDCVDPILFDFGPGSDAYFVYTRGRTVPKSGRRG